MIMTQKLSQKQQKKITTQITAPLRCYVSNKISCRCCTCLTVFCSIFIFLNTTILTSEQIYKATNPDYYA